MRGTKRKLLLCLAVGVSGWMAVPFAFAAEAQAVTPAARTAEALQLLKSQDPYQQRLGFLRLEALRDPSTLPEIRPYLDSRDPDLRAYSLRAVAAIDGLKAVPLLLERLKKDGQPRVRRAAVLGLEPLAKDDARILPALIDALRDRSTEVRMAAVDVVSRVDDPRAKKAILLRNQWEWRRDVKRVLKLAIKRIQ